METGKKNLLFVLLFLSFQVYSATDTISTYLPLDESRTIVSSGGIFELGLFITDHPAGMYNDKYYLGMWYKQVYPQTIVWVANRESSLDFSDCKLNISNGNLILQNNLNKIIWSTGVNSSSSKEVQAVLLDNGNLVLRDGPNSSAAVLWQSFDHPTDTWLPGQLFTSWKSSTDPSPGRYSLQFDPKTYSVVMVWNGSKSYWSSGPWDDRVKAFKNLSYDFYIFELNLDESYVTYSVNPVLLRDYNYSSLRLPKIFCCIFRWFILLHFFKNKKKKNKYIFAHKFLKDECYADKKQSTELLEGGIIDDDGENMCYLNLHDIMTATNAFSEENKLGEGGFGPVYKGKLPNGMDVAIKRLSKQSSQGLTEFKNEVVLIIKLQHKNLVRLLGYCVEGNEKLLIYEYMPNKSLDFLLFDSLKCRELDWEKRTKIINGITRGLQYLHEDSRLRIIHRDLKASNILLDNELNPKISDFGTARIFGCKQIDDSTQRIIGTFGYMSPEYALGGMISEKSDIYSFGVLLLEIISGKKATRFVHNDQKHSLVAYAWESWCQTKGLNIIDEALCGSYSLREVTLCIHIALLCVQDHPKDRPMISQIIYMLSNDNNLPIPKQPTFSNVLNGGQQSSSSKQSAFSINDITQTEMEAR